ncbi:MAG: thioredoxin family protein [Kiritimatiellae bacterium]|nr:thioredoxin family protein [Kiritimatiellia bacterium]
MSAINNVSLALIMLSLSVCGGDGKTATTTDDSNWRGGPSPEWFVNWDKALAEARKSGKIMFVLKTGDWSSVHADLRKQVLQKDEFLEFAGKNLVLVYLNDAKSRPLGKEQRKHNWFITDILAYGQAHQKLRLFSPDGDEIESDIDCREQLTGFLAKLERALADRRTKTAALKAKRLFSEGYDKVSSEFFLGNDLFATSTNEFKVALTGIVSVEEPRRYDGGGVFEPVGNEIGIPCGTSAKFRLEYDVPKDFKVRFSVYEKRDPDSRNPYRLGYSSSQWCTGKGVAYAFLSLVRGAGDHRVRNVEVRIVTEPALDGLPYGWTARCVPVNLNFKADTAVQMANLPAVSKHVPNGWTEDFEAARQQAAKEGKFVLLAFSGSDWCGPCMALEKEVLSQKGFVDEASAKYVLVMVSVPRDKTTLSKFALEQNDGLKKRYAIRGFPTVVIVDPVDGKEVKRRSGYRGGDPRGYVRQLDGLVDGVKWPMRGLEVKPIAPIETAPLATKGGGEGKIAGNEPMFELRSGRVVFTGPKSMEEDIRKTKERYDFVLPFVQHIYGDAVSADKPFVVRFCREKGGYRPSLDGWTVNSGSSGSCRWFWQPKGSLIYYLACCVHNGPEEPNWASIAFYVEDFIREAAGELRSAKDQIDSVLQGRNRDADASWMKKRRPHWAVFRELFADPPDAFRKYYKEKQTLLDSGVIGSKLSLSDEAAIFSRILGKDVFHVFVNHGLDVSRKETKVPIGRDDPIASRVRDNLKQE